MEYYETVSDTPSVLHHVQCYRAGPLVDCASEIGYTITVEGSQVRFVTQEENYEGSFSLRLLLEMHRLGELVHMFVEPAIVPY